MAQLEQWLTVNDDRVCPLCAPLHLKIFPTGSGPQPPRHINCRCRRFPVSADAIPPAELARLGVSARGATAALASDQDRAIRRLLVGAALVAGGLTAREIAEEIERRRRGR